MEFLRSTAITVQVWESQHQQTKTLLRRISTYICEIKVTCDECCTGALHIFVYSLVSCATKANIASVFGDMAA
jgi:hypothetical protein